MPVYRRTRIWWQSNAQEGKRLWCADEWINRGCEETKHFEVQDEPVLVARPRCSSRGEQRASSLRRRAVLRQCFVISVIQPIGSNRHS